MTDAPDFTALEGKTFRFMASASNSGPMTLHRRKRKVTLKKDGILLKAGDLKAGQTVLVDTRTGEISTAQRRRKRK